jgi:hypothetical protein
MPVAGSGSPEVDPFDPRRRFMVAVDFVQRDGTVMPAINAKMLGQVATGSAQTRDAIQAGGLYLLG